MFPLEGKKPSAAEAHRLTQFSHGSGCGCKIAPAVLEEMLRPDAQVRFSDPALLIGNETKDDAAVYDLGEGQALISTVDFFTPVVDDARQYGRIAAANALSDVYAMGGSPFLAIAVLGWPIDKLPAALARQVIAGAREICSGAGVSLAGGHTIDAPEPFFGLSVNGRVEKKHIKSNAAARAGDLLYLTKPLGSGTLSSALKRGLIAPAEFQACADSMAALNRIGAALGKYEYVHALTDVTGFGLLGHLIELCEGSCVSAELDYSAVPFLPMVKELAAQLVYADNTMRNWKSYESKVEGIAGESLLTLCDPQTSGGLLIAVSPESAGSLEALLAENGVLTAKIGSLSERREKLVSLK